MKKVVIIGGGITGLAAAYQIQQAGAAKGLDYLLVEKDDRLGGKCFSEKIDGFMMEGGPDCFLSDKPSVLQISESMGIADSILPSNEASKRTFVLNKGQLCELPEGLMSLVPSKIVPFVLSPLVSWPGKFRMAMDLFIPKKQEDADESLASFVRRRLGNEALDKIAEPLIGGIHAGNPDKMSLKATFPRFLDMEQKHGGMLKAMLAGKRNTPSPRPQKPGGKPKTFFMTFKEGMGELAEAIASRLDPKKVITGQTVTGLTVEEKDGRQVYRVAIEGMAPIEADAVILATPAFAAAPLMEKVDQEAARVLAEIPAASSATVNLAYKKSDLSGDLEAFGLVIPQSEKRKIMAVTYSSVKWNNRTPSDDYVLIRAFVGGARNQEYVDLADEEMLAMVKSEIKDIMGVWVEPVATKIYRWPKGMPQYTMGHLDRLATIKDRIAHLPGLHIVGGSYTGVGVPDCIKAGLGAAQETIEYLA